MRALNVVRGAAALGVLAATVVMVASPASAHVVGPCDGSATINGKRYTPANDTPSRAVRLPDKGTVVYQGHTQTVTAPHHGHLAVQIGPAKITIYSWHSANENKKLADQGQKSLTNINKKLPAGIAGVYKIYGYHYNDNTLYCSGFAYVRFDASPLSTPIGIVGVAGTALAGVGVLFAARGRKVRL